MKNNTFKKVNDSTRDNIHCVFLDAALVFECGGDYQLIFKKAYNRAIGHSKKMFSVMMSASPTQMEQFCMDLIKNYKEVLHV